MRLRKILLVLPLLLLSATAQARPVPNSFADLAERLSPAVVNISTTQNVKSSGVQMFPFEQFRSQPGMQQFDELFRRFEQQSAPREREVTSLGSGFVIDASGYIITNYHVISQADKITVRFVDDTKLDAKIIGKDKKTDLALLKVTSDKPLPFVTLGNSDVARVGDWVMAIGNPFGLGGTVTAGIISARQRSINAGPFDDFIQTDAAINQGNSGGPLFNMAGEVIGINSAIFSPTGGNVGIGFSIPAELAKPVINQLKQFGRTQRGWLGVQIQSVTDEIANSIGLKKGHGALVADITPGSPAAKAGLKVGDVITHYNGEQLSEMRFLPRKVAETKAGDTVKLSVWRNGKSHIIPVLIAKLDEDEDGITQTQSLPKSELQKSGTGEVILGMHLTTLTDKRRAEYKLSKELIGVVVTGVKQDSIAARRGFRPGDVLTEVNNQPVLGLKPFRRLISDAKKSGRDFALIRVKRGDGSAFVTLPLK